MTVEGLSREVLTLLQDVTIQIGQDGTVEADGVLHQQDHLHTRLLDVVLQVHLVLDKLDDGHDEVGVAQPAENIVEDAKVLVLHAARNAMREGREHHAMDLRELALDGARHGEGIIVGCTGHTDHQVDLGSGQYLLSLSDSRHLRERGRITKPKLHVFVENLLFHAAIVLEHKSVVGIGHDEHIVNATHHQVDKRHIF